MSNDFGTRIAKLFKREKSASTDIPNRSILTNYNLPTMAFYKGLTYDNTYPAITRIANEFMTIEPYAVDSNGKPLNNHPLIDSLAHPNQQWSGLYFREVIAVMALVHRKVYVLVWHNENGRAVTGGKITPTNITGFTILEGVSEISTSNGKVYQVGGAKYTDNEVIEIYSGVDPYDITGGYSPTTAVKKWAKLDDYIAAYQTGFFENGAVPSGQFIITAKSPEEFNNIVDGMQRYHRGSGKNNNVIYTHRPINAVTGSVEDAQIQWLPFANSNKELSLDALFNQANKKIDSSFGVPASIRGVNENNTYASVRVDEQIFMRYTVKPFAEKIWGQFNHELDRITGGLGIAIKFDIQLPGLADEQKVEADRKAVELSIIANATQLGYSLDSVVDAFELPLSYKLLRFDGGVNDSELEIENHKPEVDEGGEVENAPEIEQDQPESQKIARKSIDERVNRDRFIKKFVQAINATTQKQVDDAIHDNDISKIDAVEVYPDDMINAIMVNVDEYMLKTGQISYEEGMRLAAAAGYDLSMLPVERYVLTQTVQDKYRSYLKNVATSYTSETAKQIRNVLADAQANDLDKEQIADRLRALVDNNEWRAQRLALTEEHRIFGDSSVSAMAQLSNNTGVKIIKRWNSNVGDPCEFCQAMDGKSVNVSASFLSKGDKVEGKLGGSFINDFVDVDSACLHPHCMCFVKYEVVPR